MDLPAQLTLELNVAHMSAQAKPAELPSQPTELSEIVNCYGFKP